MHAECVTFRLGQHVYAVPLPLVREIVRLRGLTRLPSMTPPLAGVIDLRGQALPVLDVRDGAAAGSPGDVLVLEPAGDEGAVGVAVDRVLEVGPQGLQVAPGARHALPAYVVNVLLGESGQIFLVDPRAMCGAAAA